MTRKEQYKEQIDGVSIELLQHTEPDERFYEHKPTGKWVASVTTKLDVLPKDPFLDIWKDKNGVAAVNQVLDEAAKTGTAIHNLIDDLCKEYQETGQASLMWFDDNGYKKFNSVIWSAVMKFVDFFNNYVDDILLSEQRMFSDVLDVAGTVDGVFMLKYGRVAIVDYKYTSVLSEKFSVQTYCYKQMVEETYNMKVDVRGNLWLRSQKRGADKTGKKIQGNGWEFVEHIEDERDALIYDCANKIFMDKYRNKEIIPEHRTYPTILTIGN
jgi:hypothetical protein